MRLSFSRLTKIPAAKTALWMFWGVIFILTVLAFPRYPGKSYVYLLFTVVANLLLYFGFRKNAIFFDTFIGIFCWLGFWLKLTILGIFFGGSFAEKVGCFDGSGAAYDRALIVSSCGLFGFLLASIIREKLSYNYPQKIEGIAQKGLLGFYRNHRNVLLTGFVVLFVVVGVTNAYLGIYQRGCITQTTLPWGLNGIYKWLLLFGLASFSALFLKFEFEFHKETSLFVMFLSLMESFVSNVSLLSRGMILNSSALLCGVFASTKLHSIKSNARFFMATILIFITLFIGSYSVVNFLRSAAFSGRSLTLTGGQVLTGGLPCRTLIDRWVGMEGVMAISSYPNLGWDLWKTAWKESYNENETSFYDNNLIESQYANTDKTKNHHISLPGIIAFFFYPGSFLFLFVSMFVLGGVAAAIEGFVFWMGGKNVILCALIAQVVAYRFMSFGYVPQQSYLLFGTIFLNIIIIYLTDNALLRLYKKSLSSQP